MGSGLQLQDNSGAALPVSGSTFVFPAELASGQSYSVAVLTQPSGPSQTCKVSNGTGPVDGSNVTNISVTCTTNAYTVGGTVSGLTGSLVLQDNSNDNLSVSMNGPFTFAMSVASGQSYSVGVLTQPAGQTCGVAAGGGPITNAAISNVVVTCTTNALSSFTVGGTISGLSGTGLVLQDNGGDNLSVSANGPFTFATALTSGSNYAVSVVSQPGSPAQYCWVSNGSGPVQGANVVSVSLVCRSTGQFVYVTTTYGGGVSNGLITMFAIDPATGLLDREERHYSNGVWPLGIALDTSGQDAYVAYVDQSAVGISTETITQGGASAGQIADGSTTDIGAGTTAYSLIVDPKGPYLYAGGTSMVSTGTLFAYSISAGVLTPLSTSSYIVGGLPYGLVTDPAGKFLYVPTSSGGTIWGYSINSDGSLTTLNNGAPFGFQGGASSNTPYAIAANPEGGYLYITDTTANTVSVYSYDPVTGVPSLVGQPYPVGASPESVAVDPTGEFLYVANAGDGTVSAFTIGSTGGLTPVAGTPFATGGGSSMTPTAVAVEPSGQYTYVTTGDAQTVAVFAITPSTGVLTPIDTASTCPTGDTCTVGNFGGTGGASGIAIE
jgi:6-phosphogluconolactonase (cycloisomerase 2 family)